MLCAADEVAVELFLNHSISFTDIARIVQKTLEQHQNVAQPSLEEILAADTWAREYAKRLSLGHCKSPPFSCHCEESKRRSNLRLAG